jgi:hypothetical protein
LKKLSLQRGQQPVREGIGLQNVYLHNQKNQILNVNLRRLNKRKRIQNKRPLKMKKQMTNRPQRRKKNKSKIKRKQSLNQRKKAKKILRKNLQVRTVMKMRILKR